MQAQVGIFKSADVALLALKVDGVLVPWTSWTLNQSRSPRKSMLPVLEAPALTWPKE